jgi:hypothetical protein
LNSVEHCVQIVSDILSPSDREQLCWDDAAFRNLGVLERQRSSGKLQPGILDQIPGLHPLDLRGQSIESLRDLERS